MKEKMSLVYGVIVPNNFAMPWECVKSWLNAPKYPVAHCQGPDLNFNRNMVWKRAVEYQKVEPSHLLIIDSDIVFKPEDVAKIEFHLNRGLDAVTGIYPIGQEPYIPCIFERVEGDYKPTQIKEGINEIGACGAGFMGINKNVILNMVKDPFDNIKEGDIFHGEDITFCHRLAEKGYKLFADSKISLGHVRTQTIYA